jgi:hypothetical protein
MRRPTPNRSASTVFAFLLASWIVGLCQVAAAPVPVDDLWNNTARFEQVGKIDSVPMPHGCAAENAGSFAV